MKKSIVPLAILITIALGIFIYINRFIDYSVVEIDGYAFKTNDLAENLNDSNDKKNISLQKVIVNEPIYKSNTSFYVGEEKKKKINLDYPIVSKDSSTLYIASNVGDYITEDFDHEVSYPGTIITDSKLYNTNDYEQATDCNYFFVGLNNGLFINLSEIEIKSYSYDIKIPVNSFIKFEENSLRYYYLYKGKYLYKDYPVIDSKDTFTISNYKDNYYETMVKLSVIVPKVEYEEEDTNKTKNKSDTSESSEIAESSPEYIKQEKHQKDGNQWIAPEIYIKDTYAKTYSYRGIMSISDPSATISKSPTFEFRINGSVALRKTVNSNGSFKITGLLPSTKYEVSAYYEYYDENNVKRQKKIQFNGKEYFDVFTTEGTENLNELNFDLGKITTETDSFRISSMKLKNNIEDEVLNGIKNVTIKTVDGNFVLPSSDVKNLSKLVDFSYKSAKILKSNKDYNATIIVTDTAGNVIPAKNNTFSFKTKQKAPSAKLNVEVFKNFTKAELTINITNSDNVDVSKYTYYVYDENNELFASASAYEDVEKYMLENLDTAKKYTIKLLCDYKTNENIVFKDVEIGDIEFVSYDIEKLGSIPFTVSANSQRDDYITSSAASIAVSYANYDPNDSIYELIDNEITINVVNKESGIVEYSKTANKYDFIVDHIFDICYTGERTLSSNTDYKITIDVFVTSGDKKIPIKTAINSRGYEFKTLKAEAYVSLSNIFIASGYIDFDAIVIDRDGAILDNNEQQADTINFEIYNTAKEKVYSDVLRISHFRGIETNRITIDSLNENQLYSFVFKASNYNDNLNSESNKVLLGSNDFHLSGIKSRIDVEEMVKTTNYYNEAEENLFELEDIVRWQSKHYSTYSPTERISISEENNTITLGAYNGYRVYNYYLPELIGKDVVMSFKAKRGNDRTGRICIMNNMTNNANNCFMNLDIDEDDYTEYSNITFNLNSTGYISFYIAESDNQFYTNSLILKDLKIEVGTESTAYKKYNNQKGYIGTFNTTAHERVNPEDENPNILLNQGIYEYYVSLVKNGVRDRIELFETTDGIITYDDIVNSVIFDNLEKDEDYRVTFSVYDKDLERYYDLSSVAFETEAEIRVIRNINDFFNMHKNGHYIAINDLDFTSVKTTYSGMFSGTLDMQGHKMIIDSDERSYLIENLGGGGVIENANIHFILNNTKARTYFYGLIYDNYGLIQNFSVTIDESVSQQNAFFSLLGWRNFGVIQNFYFHSKAPVYGYKYTSLGTRVNYGTIKNAYAYADPGVYAIDVSTNIPSADGNEKITGIFAMESSSGSIIENVYVTSKIYIGEEPGTKDKVVGTIVGYVSSGTLRNIYVYDDSNSTTNKRDKSKDIMVGKVSNLNYSNLYYISEFEYKELYSSSRKLTALKNVNFQDQVLNNDLMFITDKAWRLNIYPLLDLPDCMPTQEQITLPSITGDDIKFLSVDDIKYLDNEYVASLALSFYNPNGLNIKGINIDNIAIVDMVNKPSTNSDMITTVNVKLKNPAEYVSNYTLSSIVTNTGTIELDVPMVFDLYMEISNITSITDMKTNYRLVSDIDCSVDNCKSLGTYYGKLNGSGHTISNMKVSSCFISSLRGTLKDINFTNFENTDASSKVGIVCTLESNGDIDNVSSYDSKLKGFSNNNLAYIGGIVSYVNSGTISNSSVNKMTVNPTTLNTAMPNIGGIAGYGSNVIIDTCLARNINVESTSLPADNTGIGGIIGVFASGKITNVYATGEIKNNTQYLGGIAGKVSGSTASIIEAVENVKINAEQDYLGGITGFSASTNNLSKTIVLGDLSTKKQDAEYYDRTCGTSINRSRNYAWDKQALNNVITQDTNGETLLTQDELWNPVIYSSKIGFGAHWVLDDDNFRREYIPLLKSPNGSIVRGQGYYDDEDKNIEDLRIFYEALFTLDSYKVDDSEAVYTEGHEGDKYYIEKNGLEVNIYNPNMFEIKSIEIDGMAIDSIVQYPTNDQNTNITTIKYVVRPERYYDNYYVTKVTYYDDNREEQTYDVNFSLEIPFFYNLKTANDWKRIEKTYYENYILDRDLDLSGLTSAQLADKSFNRLVGIGNKRTIKGANVTVNTAGSAFLYTIVSEITNLKFENITFKNSVSGNYTGLIKYLNGSMENIDFYNINMDGSKASYTGVISINQAPIIRNINAEKITIKGINYVGFIGQSNVLPKTNIHLKNITINATGSYVGGLYGYEKWKEKGVYSSYIVGDDIKINQNTSKYGNYIGGLFGYGSGTNVTVVNSKIKGNNSVGGVSGQHSNRTNDYIYSYNNTISGNTYVGGIAGANQPITGALVYNSSITGNSQTGGISGYSSWPTITGSGSIGNTIKGNNYTGGIVGYTNSCSTQYNYVRDTNVTGTNYVGGIIGATGVSDNAIQYNTTNATVTATNANAGGIIGYFNNTNTTSSRYRTRLYYNVVAGSKVTAVDYAGGLVGRIEKAMYSNQFTNQYVDADIACTNPDSVHCGYVIGTNDAYANIISRLYVYEDTSITIHNNKTKFSESTSYTSGELFGSGKVSGIATYNDIKTDAFYKTNGAKLRLNGFTWNVNTLQSTYPRPNYGKITAKTIPNLISEMPYSFVVTYKDANDKNRTLQSFALLPLPTQNRSSSVISGRTINMRYDAYVDLPNPTVYVSSVDTINVEFNSISPDSVFTINDSEEYFITNRTFTFKYNFIDDVTIRVSDGNGIKEITYTKDDLRNRISVLENNYYFLKSNKIVSNDTNINIKDVVNIYEDKALLTNGKIYLIKTNETIDNSFNNLESIDPKPLYKFTYLDEDIYTYYNYSIVNNEIYNGQLFVKNDNLEIMDKSIKNKKDKLIIDQYNNKDYLLYLRKDGVLYSLKENINYPKEFMNIDIADISSNVNTNTDIIFVLYKDGNYIVFNYKTGTLVAESYENTPTIYDYISTNYRLMVTPSNLDEPVPSGYKEAEKLVKKLSQTSIDDVLENKDNISKDRVNNSENAEISKYTIRYNNNTGTYDIYEMADTSYNEGNINSNSTILRQIKSPDVKKTIKKSKVLSSYYDYNPNVEQLKATNVFVRIILVTIGLIISTAIIILGNLIIKKISFRRV